MPEIRGRYEYDDDDLTPGKKKEGGLHQNLFDSDGNLKGSARFIPDDDEPDPLDGSSPDDHDLDDEYDEEARRRAEEQAELAALAIEVLLRLIATGIVKGAPHAARLWNEKVRPTFGARWDRLVGFARRRKPTSERPTDAVPVLTEATVVESSQDLVAVSAENRVDMSRSEAQARYLLALAARAFSDEQLRLVSTARIHEDDGFLELRRAVAELPASEAANILENLEADPSLFTTEALAQLARNGPVHDGYLAIEARSEP